MSGSTFIKTTAWIFAALFVACSSGSRNSNSDGDNASVDCTNGKITVFGEAPIFTSMDAAEGKAKEDACRTAIEKCIGTQVASISGVGNGQSIANEIFAKANGVCRDGRILEKNEYMLDTVKMLRLSMRYEIQPADLRSQIDQMQKLAGNPKVMILIREEYNLAGQGKRAESFSSRNAIAAAALRDFLVRKDYTVIDSSAISMGGANEEVLADNPADFPEDIKERAAKAGADVLIIGSLEANPQANINLSDSTMNLSMKSYKATGNVTLMTLWGKGKVLGEFSVPAGGAQTTDLSAAQQAVKRFAVGAATDPVKQPGGIGKEIHRRLTDQWSEITRSNLIIVKVTGLTQGQAGAFRDDLKEKSSVRSVNPLNETDSEQEWEVTYPGRSFALADTISRYRDNPRIFRSVKESGKKANVVSVNRGEIVVKFE